MIFVRFAILLGLLGVVAPVAADSPPATATPATSALPRTPSPAGARVYFIAPKDGEHIKGDVVVRFGLSGMGVAPAGIKFDNSGHHHLLVDTELPPMDQPLGKDDHHLHFGGGQTETTLKLAPGKHTLQLLLADYLHQPHEPAVVSERITITVE